MCPPTVYPFFTLNKHIYFRLGILFSYSPVISILTVEYDGRSICSTCVPSYHSIASALSFTSTVAVLYCKYDHSGDGLFAIVSLTTRSRTPKYRNILFI